MKFKINKKYSGAILAGTVAVSAFLDNMQQNTSANLLTKFFSNSVSSNGKGVLELLAKRVLPAAIIVLLGILAYKYFTSGGSSNLGKKEATAEDAPPPKKISLGAALWELNVCSHKIDVQKIFKPVQGEESLAKKCREMFNELKEKFSEEDLRFELEGETIEKFLKISFEKNTELRGKMFEIIPEEIHESGKVKFKLQIGLPKVIKEYHLYSRQPILNVDFFNMLSILANQKYTYGSNLEYVVAKADGDFEVIDDCRRDDLIYISEDQEDIQKVKSVKKLEEIAKKIDENVLDLRTDLAKLLDRYKIDFSGVVEKAFDVLEEQSADFEKIKLSIKTMINFLENSEIVLKKKDLQFLTGSSFDNLSENEELKVKIVKGSEENKLYFKIIGTGDKVYETKSSIKNMHFINLLNIARYKSFREKGENHQFINFINEHGEYVTLSKGKDIESVFLQIEEARKKTLNIANTTKVDLNLRSLEN